MFSSKQQTQNNAQHHKTFILAQGRFCFQFQWAESFTKTINNININENNI